MTSLEHLPPDQRATLTLLLSRGKSCEEVASLLNIEPQAVHDRAHAALAVLAPRLARQLDAESRERIGEYLLGQQDESAASDTKARLSSSAPEREWARALALQLVQLTAGSLPQIPQGPGELASASSESALANGSSQSAPGSEGDLPDDPPASGLPEHPPTSRRGGAIVLAAIAVLVVVGVLIALNSGNPSKGTANPSASTREQAAQTQQKATQRHHGKLGSTSTTSGQSDMSGKEGGKSGTAGGSGNSGTSGTSGKSSASGRKIESQMNLTAAESGSSAAGVLLVVSENSQKGLLLDAEHLPPTSGFVYYLWLVDSSGKAKPYPIVAPSVPSSGKSKERMIAVTLLPPTASSYDKVELTKQTEASPTSPSSEVVLDGSFKLH